MIYLTEKQLSEYILKYSQRLEDSGLNKDEVEIRLESHLKTNVVIKYTKAWQDRVYKELMYIWTEVPGGYWPHRTRYRCRGHSHSVAEIPHRRSPDILGAAPQGYDNNLSCGKAIRRGEEEAVAPRIGGLSLPAGT